MGIARISLLLAASLGGVLPGLAMEKPGVLVTRVKGEPVPSQIQAAFRRQGLAINAAEAQGIHPQVILAIQSRNHTQIGFSAVEIAADLGLDTREETLRRIRQALEDLRGAWDPSPREERPMPPPTLSWDEYYQQTLDLWNRPEFLGLMNRHRLHPVKISWEDIGRNENSAWGDRISDVGIWVRQYETNADSARLALSVRRDSNFRDKVLMVPSDRIKIHAVVSGRTVEKTLPERLRELGLASAHRDRNVIVSNQFAIVPVPHRAMTGAWPEGVSPRTAFTFSIYPYGSTNYVITDVIEGSHEAIVGPGSHQLLFANIHGGKAPFTASRAEDRPDLLQMERELKAKGMDVDVQRYYLIQIPLRRDASGIQTSQMGTPPQRWRYAPSTNPYADPLYPQDDMVEGGLSAPLVIKKGAAQAEGRGVDKVAIGHGATEGRYFGGAGYRGARAEEPIRVTVVYFVTPRGRITDKDMETFARTFAQWDSQAIWGGSFVTPGSD